MSEATRLEQALAATEREAYDLVPVVRGCVEGYRASSPGREIAARASRASRCAVRRLARTSWRSSSTSSSTTPSASRGRARRSRWSSTGTGGPATLSVANEGPPLPAEMERAALRVDGLVRPARAADAARAPHLGLGLYIVRLVAEFHGGSAAAHDRPDGRGVIVTVTLPLEAA